MTTPNPKPKTQNSTGFTLIELLIVLIIVGILAGLSIPSYTKTRERALDREAQTALSLIQAAERMYRLREAAYINCADTTAVNTNLQLNLASQSWNYNVISASATDFLGQAVRVAGALRTWQINATNANAACTGTCL